MVENNDITDLLVRIKLCIEDCKLRKWGNSKHYIFKGSYDVWETENDGIKFDDIMNFRLNEARNLGLIVNESGNKEWKDDENWTLTAFGDEYLKSADLSKYGL